jgi:hypothetical protein
VKNHTKHKNKPDGQNPRFFYANSGNKYGDHSALNFSVGIPAAKPNFKEMEYNKMIDICTSTL